MRYVQMECCFDLLSSIKYDTFSPKSLNKARRLCFCTVISEICPHQGRKFVKSELSGLLECGAERESSWTYELCKGTLEESQNENMELEISVIGQFWITQHLYRRHDLIFQIRPLLMALWVFSGSASPSLSRWICCTWHTFMSFLVF